MLSYFRAILILFACIHVWNRLQVYRFWIETFSKLRLRRYVKPKRSVLSFVKYLTLLTCDNLSHPAVKIIFNLSKYFFYLLTRNFPDDHGGFDISWDFYRVQHVRKYFVTSKLETGWIIFYNTTKHWRWILEIIFQ